MPDYAELLAACHKPFRYWEHEFNPQGHIYVKIQQTVLRLNSLGVPWDLIQGDPIVTDNPELTKSGKRQFDAVCAVQLSIDGLGTRGALAATTNFDKDNAVKTAHSLALRKAGSLFGISHYLMVNPKAESAFVRFMETADLSNLTDLKKAVKMCADIEGIDPVIWMSQYGIVEIKDRTVENLSLMLKQIGRI